MKRRKLKGFVLPTIYGLVVVCLFLTVYFLNNSLNFKAPIVDDNSKPVNNGNQEKPEEPVVKPMVETPLKPFNKDTVGISKSFYKMTDEVEKQQNSLIYYQNTYMQNSGILYHSDETFEVLASLDGVVKEVKDDEILGTVVVIEHNAKVSMTYYSLSDVKVKAGDNVKQNDIIGTSGANKLENEKTNCLLFEVYISGNLTDPEEFYQMTLESLK